MVLVPQCARRNDVLLANDGDLLARWARQLQQQNVKDENGHAHGHRVMPSRINIWRLFVFKSGEARGISEMSQCKGVSYLNCINNRGRRRGREI